MTKCTRKALYGYFIGKGGLEMKHIQQYYRVKMYILWESANQNFVIVGERNDEDHAVPSVMKFFEKFTEKEVDENDLGDRR